jgi:hypothetical protein
MSVFIAAVWVCAAVSAAGLIAASVFAINEELHKSKMTGHKDDH